MGGTQSAAIRAEQRSGSLNEEESEVDSRLVDTQLGVLFPENSELRLREGNKVDPIPHPGASEQSQYSQILHSDDFKTHLFKNLDNDYLLSSLLTSNVSDRTVLLEGIQRLKCIEGETKEKLEKDIANFEHITTAGVNLDLRETLENCEKELDFQGEIDVSPFLLSFQRRLALLTQLKPFLLREQKKAHEQYTPRIFSSASQELSSSKFPELELLHSLKDAGVSVLDIFSTCYPLIKQSGSPAAQLALRAPVVNICNDICMLPDLRLYSCWVPAPEPLKIAIDMNSSNATCSNGQASAAVDGKATTAWTTNKLRASWSMQFDEATYLSSIRLSFVPGVSTTAGLGAPRRVIISVLYADESTESSETSDDKDRGPDRGFAAERGEETKEDGFEAGVETTDVSEGNVANQRNAPVSGQDKEAKYVAVKLVMPDVEFIKQGTWKQTYILDDSDSGGKDELTFKKVIAIKLVFSRRATANLTDNIKMYSFNAFAQSKETKRFNTMDDMESLAHSLFPVLTSSEQALQDSGLDAILSLIRSSGSLKVLLIFISHVYELHSSKGEQGQGRGQTLSCHGNITHFKQLFEAIETESEKIQERLSSSGFDTLNDVVFSGEKHSADGIEITEDGLKLSCWSGNGVSPSTTAQRVYSFLSNTMDEGIWVWDISILSDLSASNFRSTATVNTTAFGVGSTEKLQAIADYENSSHVYMVQCVTGKIFHGGLVEGASDLRVPAMKQNDVVRFCYDATASTLSITINGKYLGVIFEGIPSGYSPVVVLAGERKTVRLLRVMHKPHNIQHKKQASVEAEDGDKNNDRNVDSMTSLLRSESPVPTLAEQHYHNDDSSIMTKVTSVLLRVSCLGKLRMREVSKSFGGQEKVEFNDVHPSSLLEHPYCVAVGISTMTLLVNLLEKFQTLECDTTEKKTSILSILSLLDAQFFSLTISQCDPAQAGFPKKKTAKYSNSTDKERKDEPTAADKQVEHAANILIQFSKESDVDIQIAAARVYARGAAIFLPSVMDKVDLVLKLMDNTDSVDSVGQTLYANNADNRPRSDTISDSNGGSAYVILEIIVSRLSSLSDVHKIVESIKASRGSETMHLKIRIFLQYLLKTAAFHSNKCFDPTPTDTTEAAAKSSSFAESICLLLSRFQESLVMDVLSCIESSENCKVERHKKISAILPTRKMLLSYFELLKVSSLTVLRAANEHREKNLLGQMFGAVPTTEKRATPSDIDNGIRNSIVGVLLQPFIHSVCFTSQNLELSETLLPVCLHLLEDLSTLCRHSPVCKRAQEELSMYIQRRSPVESLKVSGTDASTGSGKGGWKTVSACFESYSQAFESNDDNTMYTSTTSGNTCGLIDIPFSGQDKAAWEVELMSDTLNDECSLFGCAKKPLTSRCYSSSSDLWMRRAYNGYMYAQGRTASRTMERIHKGDVVRVEFDAREGTLSYGVNGAEVSVGFTGITDEIYPAIGSYRSGVVVKLLKVEVFKSHDEKGDVMRSPDKLDWVLPELHANKREPNILCYPPQKSKDTPLSPWITSRADFGASSGIHEWSFEILERSRAFYALGISTQGQEAQLPTETKLGRKVSDASASADLVQMAWYSDGTLWANGALCGEGFGASFLPLGRLCSVTMRVDFDEGTLSFFVDGAFVGIAFGPEGSSAVCTKFSLHSVPKSQAWDRAHAIYPAATISSTTHQIRIKPTGFYGSVVVPLELMLQKAAASVFGRLGASLLKGLKVDTEEHELLPWLQTPMFIGGLDADLEATLSRSGSGRSKKKEGHGAEKEWDEVWKAQKGIADVETSDTSTPPIASLPIPDTSLSGSTLGPPDDSFPEDGFLADDADDDAAIEAFLCQLTQPNIQPQVQRFLDWLEKISPEPAFLQKAFKASGAYSFPRAEMPFLGALIKHGGLQKEAFAIHNAIEACLEATTSASTGVDNKKELPVPSATMKALWRRLQQLRLFLRKQRQLFKASAASPVETLTPSVTITDDSVNVVTGTSTNGEAELQPQPLSAPAEQTATSVTASASPRSSEANIHFYGEDAQIAWMPQDATEAASTFDDPDEGRGITCDVLETGVDHDEACIFVRFRAHPTYGDNIEDELVIDGPAGSALLMSRTADMNNMDFILTSNNTSTCVSGVIRFDLEVSEFEAIMAAGTVKFRYTGIGTFSECTLALNTEPIEATDSWNVNSTTLSDGIVGDESSDGVPDSTTQGASSGSKGSTTKNGYATNFEELCDSVEERSRFLFSLSPAAGTADDPDSKTRASLIGLLDKYAPSSTAYSQPKLRRLRSQDGHERWRRVIDFLRVHSTVSQRNSYAPLSPSASAGSHGDGADALGLNDWADVQNKISGSSSPMRNRGTPGRFQEPFEAAIETIDDFEDPSPAQAAMQACGLFVTIDDSGASPTNLIGLIRRRRIRARQRVFAMQALQTSLQAPDVVADPYCLNELLLFVRMAMEAPKKTRDQNSDAAVKPIARAHYLVNLEGCPAQTLMTVQSAFLSLFTELSRIISQYIAAWGDKAQDLCEPHPEVSLGPADSFDSKSIEVLQPHIAVGSIKLMLSLWILGYSNRDHRFVMQSGLIQSLYKLLSLASLEKVAQCSRNASERMSDYVMQFDHRFPDVRRWQQWAPSQVVSRLRTGALPCRSVLHHLQMIPDSVIDKEERRVKGISESLQSLCKSNGVSETSLLHETLGNLIETNKKGEALMKAAAEVKSTEDAKLRSEELSKRLASAGIFETSDAEVTLAEHGRVATFPRRTRRFHNPAVLPHAVYVANIEFAKPLTPSVPPALEDTETRGNYFEVTITQIGDGGISIGLSAERMINALPGKSESSLFASFGYLGSTGEKHGRNSTEGNFPLFIEGDTIGCGIDYKRDVLYYTRNGALLGDAFTSISDTCAWTEPPPVPAVGDAPPMHAPQPLIPVVAFLNQCTEQQAVRINFGIDEFVYNPSTGAGASISDVDLLTPSAVFAHPGALIERKLQEEEEQTGLPLLSRNVSRSNSIHITDGDDEGAAGVEADTDELTEDSYAEKTHTMLKQCEAGMAYESELLTLRNYASALMRFILIETCRSDSDYDAPLQDTVASNALPPQFTTPALMRGISLFGTPKHITRDDGVFLQEGISAAIIQQLILGATYLSRCEAPDLKGNTYLSEDAATRRKRKHKATMPLACVPPSEKQHTIKITQDEQLDPDDGASESTVSMSDMTAQASMGSRLSSNHSNSSSQMKDAPVLEAVEIENVLYLHLTTLAALISSTKSLRKEISKSKSVGALILLLQSGSPRIKTVTASIAQRILPGMVPEEVEQSLNKYFHDPLAAPAESRSRTTSGVGVGVGAAGGDGSASKRRQRRMPDSLVRTLLSNVRDSLRIDCWSAEEGTGPDARPDIGYPTSDLPFGAGKQSLTFADQNIAIVQALFEAPMWTELIACNITDSLRHAISVIKDLHAQPDRTALSVDEEETLLTACASCCTICGLGTFYPGVSVISQETKVRGIYLWASVSEDAAKVIFEDVKIPPRKSEAPQNSMNNIEEVKLSSLHPASEGANVDLSRLSQPLLPHMMSVMQLLLERHLKDDRKSTVPSSMSAVLMRLNYLISTAMTVLLDRQADMVIDATHDIDIVGDIVDMALQPTGMDHFPSLEQVGDMWRHTQGRALEAARLAKLSKPQLQRSKSSSRSRSGSIMSAGGGASTRADKSRSGSIISIGSNHSDSERRSSASAAAIIAQDASSTDSDEEDVSAAGDVLYHDDASRRARQERANVIAVEMEINASIVLRHLEFYMMDEGRARESLRALASSGHIGDDTSNWDGGISGTESASSQAPSSRDAVSDTPAVSTLSEDELSRIVEQASTNPSADGVGDCVVYDMDLERILEPVMDEVGNNVFCKRIPCDTYLIECAEEGPVNYSQASGRVCVSTASTSASNLRFVASFFDPEIGVDIAESVEFSDMRVVTSFYDKRTSLAPHRTMFELDQAACILSMRRMASKLMIESSLNLAEKSITGRKSSPWLGLLRLATTGGSSKYLDSTSGAASGADNGLFHSMLSSLLTRARGYANLSQMSALQLELPIPANAGASAGGLPTPPTMAASPFPQPVMPPSPSSDELSASFPSPRARSLLIPSVAVHVEGRGTGGAVSGSSGLVVGGTGALPLSPMRADSATSSVESGIVLSIVSDMEGIFSDFTHEAKLEQASKHTSNHKSPSGSTSIAVTSSSGSSAGSSMKEAEEKDLQIVASPHPFTAPCRMAGRIDFPKSWSGAVLAFHPSSCTPSSLATLKIYRSEVDYAKGENAEHIFAGSSSFYSETDPVSVTCNGDLKAGTAQFPHSVVLNGWESFYYIFEAQVGADMPALHSIALQGTFVDGSGDTLQLADTVSSPVGLGEEDTLFNLFNTDTADNQSDVSIAIASCEPFKSGSWYFEAEVMSSDLDRPDSAISSSSAGTSDNVRIGLWGSSFLLGEDTEATEGEFLGNSPWSVALGEMGDVFAQGCRVVDGDGVSLQPLRSKDVVSVHFTVHIQSDSNMEASHVCVTFACNGFWGKQSRLDLDTLVDGKACVGVRPACSLRSQGTKVVMNYGTQPFKHSNTISMGNSWLPLCARSPGDADFARKCAFGFEFAVQRMENLQTHIAREFKLVTHINVATTSKTKEDSANAGLWIWRPKIPKKWGKCFGIGDIVTSSSRPPRGALVVNQAQIKVPSKMQLVISDSSEFSIWRPVVEGPDSAEWVAMGDILSKGNSAPSMKDLLESGECPALIPKWAVKDAPLGKRIFGAKGSLEKTNRSMWSVRNGLGTFFGSPTESRVYVSLDDDEKVKDWKTDVKGVSAGYALKQPLGSNISGEWGTEDDAHSEPSLKWGSAVLSFLLDNPRTQEMVVRAKTFSILVAYIQSCYSPAPLVAVTPLIRMIRAAQEKGISLPLEQVDPLCKTILTKATQTVQKSADNAKTLSDAMLTLVDLVVGVQSAQVARRTGVELRSWLGKHPAMQQSTKQWLFLQRQAALGNRSGETNKFVVNYIDTIMQCVGAGQNQPLLAATAGTKSDLGAIAEATPTSGGPEQSLSPRAGEEIPHLYFESLSAYGAGTEGSRGAFPFPLQDRSASAPDFSMSPFRDIDAAENPENDSAVSSPYSMPLSPRSPRDDPREDPPFGMQRHPLSMWSAFEDRRDLSLFAEFKELSNLNEQWWMLPDVSEATINEELLVHPSRVEVLAKENISRKLKMVLSFLAALNADIHPSQKALEQKLFDSEFKPSFPKLMLCKIWYEFASLAVCEESSHPYYIGPDETFTTASYEEQQELLLDEEKNSETAKADSSSREEVKLVIRVDNVETGQSVHFKIRNITIMGKIFDAYALRISSDQVFVYRMPDTKGNRIIRASDTPMSLGLENNDVITVRTATTDHDFKSAEKGTDTELSPATVDAAKGEGEKEGSSGTLTPPLEQLGTMKVWQKHRRIYFPGSSRVVFYLDRRTALGSNAKLILRSTSSPEQIRILSASMESVRSAERSLVFDGPEVIVTFQVCGSADGKTPPENADDAWGWAFMAVGSDDGLDKAEVSLPLISNSATSPSTPAKNSEVLTTKGLAEESAAVCMTTEEKTAFLMYMRMKTLHSITKEWDREDGHRPEENASATSDAGTIDVDGIMKALDKTLTVSSDGDTDKLVEPASIEVASSALLTEDRPCASDAPRKMILKSEFEEDILTRIKASQGYMTGTLRVPYSQESDLFIERSAQVGDRQWTSDVYMFFELHPISGEKPTLMTAEILNDGNSVGCRLKVDGDCIVKYHVFVITIKAAEAEPEPIADVALTDEPTFQDVAGSTGGGEVKDTTDAFLPASDAQPPAPSTGSSPPEGVPSTGFPDIDAALNAAAGEMPLVEEAGVPTYLLDVWSCPVCTLNNANSDTSCGMCATPRPGGVSGEDASAYREAGGGGGGGAGAGAGWWCSTCTFINPIATTSCTICETARDPRAAGEEDEDEDEDEDQEEEEEELFEENPRTAGRRAAVASDAPVSPSAYKEKNKLKGASEEPPQGPKDTLKIIMRTRKMNTEDKCRARLRAAVAAEVAARSVDKSQTSSSASCTSTPRVSTSSPAMLPRHMKNIMSRWTPEADAILLEYINNACTNAPDKINSFYSYSNTAAGCLPLKYLQYQYGEILSQFTMIDIQSRILLLGAFNKSLEDLIPLVNLKNTDFQSVGAMIRRCNRYIFLNTKQDMLDKVITATTARSGPGLPASLVLNNATAMASRDAGETEPSNSQCVFVQAFRVLQHKEAIVYRHIFASDRVFQINFTGEMGIDAGGVFREGVSVMVQDLFSEHFNLLILCPNGQHETHMNCEKYVPNPKHTGPLAMSMLEFVGKMMAMSLRAKLMLPFEFPSIIWKKLCGVDPEIEDLHAIDAITCTLLKTLRTCEDDGILDQESFSTKYGGQLRWTYNGSDGVERELYPGSDTVQVTYANKEEYCDAVQKMRLHEFDEHIAALSRGFVEVLPEPVIQLFSWEQVEILVAGSPVVDIALWKSQTINGVSAKLYALFWKVMTSLTEKEQSQFIRFAWGRSRLPPLKEFTTKMRLTAGDGSLPIAHTCFFSIELPDYDTEEEMRHGLLTAIHFGVGGVLVS